MVTIGQVERQRCRCGVARLDLRLAGGVEVPDADFEAVVPDGHGIELGSDRLLVAALHTGHPCHGLHQGNPGGEELVQALAGQVGGGGEAILTTGDVGGVRMPRQHRSTHAQADRHQQADPQQRPARQGPGRSFARLFHGRCHADIIASSRSLRSSARSPAVSRRKPVMGAVARPGPRTRRAPRCRRPRRSLPPRLSPLDAARRDRARAPPRRSAPTGRRPRRFPVASRLSSTWTSAADPPKPSPGTGPRRWDGRRAGRPRTGHSSANVPTRGTGRPTAPARRTSCRWRSVAAGPPSSRSAHRSTTARTRSSFEGKRR